MADFSTAPCVAISAGSGDHTGEFTCKDGDRTVYMGAPPAGDEQLAPCPFCGCDYADTEEASGLEVCNTHTPSFWICCNACGAEHHANEHAFPEPVEVGGGVKDYTAEMFVKARAAAVAAWNRRDLRWRTREDEQDAEAAAAMRGTV